MGNSITLSPKYGVNPTIPVCFWCGEEKNEVALMGHIGNGRKHEDFEAPMHMVLDFEPCEECKKRMAMGFTVMEATTSPNSVSRMEMQKGVYPTGRFVVIKTEAAKRIFTGIADGVDKGFIDSAGFSQLFGEGSV